MTAVRVAPASVLTAAASPTRTAELTATQNVSGAKNDAKRRPNVPGLEGDELHVDHRADDHEGQPGGERELRQAGGHEGVGLRADGQDRRPGRPGRARRAAPRPATLSSTERGTRVCSDAAVARADDEEAAGVEEVVLGGLHERAEARRLPRARCVGPWRPTRRAPSRSTRSRPRRRRAGWRRSGPAPSRVDPGKATAVATSTTGFTAGADSRNVTRRGRRHAAGNEPPGDRHRAAFTARQAHSGHRCDRHGEARTGGQRPRQRCRRHVGRDGAAHRQRRARGRAAPERMMATKIVAQLWRASASSPSATSGRSSAAPTTSPTSTGRARAWPERAGSFVSTACVAGMLRP